MKKRVVNILFEFRAPKDGGDDITVEVTHTLSTGEVARQPDMRIRFDDGILVNLNEGVK